MLLVLKGQGFGWKDINVYKVGASYQLNPQLTLRAGYSHNDQPISESQTFKYFGTWCY